MNYFVNKNYWNKIHMVWFSSEYHAITIAIMGYMRNFFRREMSLS